MKLLRHSAAGALAYALSAGWAYAQPGPRPPAAPAAMPGIDTRLGSMTASLDKGDPPMFVLRYHDERIGFSGPICYAFHGYNETCMRMDLGHLSQATRIRLHAPGGVPVELLDGYELLVRFPQMSETQFRFKLQ